MSFVVLLSVASLSVVAIFGKTVCPGGLQCVDVKACSPLLLLLKKPKRTVHELEQLQNSFCGYVGTSPQVCCPDASCRTPDDQPGSCVSLFECPHLVAMLNQTHLSTDMSDYARRSSCSGPAVYNVCCGLTPPPAPPSLTPLTPDTPAAPGQCPVSALPPPSDSECCGRERFNGFKVTGGSTTALDEYPWMVIIEYTQNNTTQTVCVGALISSRYVLTAAHCLIVSRELELFGDPVSVRLGEYDTVSEKDCKKNNRGIEECNDPSVILPIESYVPHPQYGFPLRSRRNDIGIIRIAKDAPYTDFIRPICLPTTDITKAPTNNIKLWVAGWGKVNTSLSSSNVKLHVDLPYFPLDQCRLVYDRNHPILWNKQLCAGGVKDKDWCNADAGAPLMHENGRTFEMAGIASFGRSRCGLEGIPSVYTKVYEYIDWIRSEMHN